MPHRNVAVRCRRRDSEEEWRVVLLQFFESVVQEAMGFFGHNVRRILAVITHRSVVIPLKCGIQVTVSEGVQKKVAPSPAGGVRRVVVEYSLCVEQLTYIVSSVPSILEPYWKIGLVETLRYELRIPAYQEILPR